MRLVLLVVACGVQWGLSVWQMVRDLDHSTAPWLQAAAFGALAAVAAVTAVGLVLRWSPPPPVEAILTTTCLAAGVAANAASPSDRLVTSDDWVFGLVGWFGLMLLVHRRLAVNALFLLAHLVLTVGAVIVTGDPDRDRLLAVATSVIPVFGLQLLAAFVLQAARDTISVARAAAEQEEVARTQEWIIAQRREDRRERASSLRADVVPLLAGLADGTLDPADPEVRRRSGLEAARMRRLFAEQDSVPDPLVHGLHAGIELAERRGVSVVLSVRGVAVDVPQDVRRHLIDATMAGLSWVESTARVTVLRTARAVRLAVTGDLAGGSRLPYDRCASSIAVTVVESRDELMWEVRWDRT
jgi:hypothetical protein